MTDDLRGRAPGVLVDDLDGVTPAIVLKSRLLGRNRSVIASAFIGSNRPTRRHYFRFVRDPGPIQDAPLIGL